MHPDRLSLGKLWFSLLRRKLNTNLSPACSLHAGNNKHTIDDGDQVIPGHLSPQQDGAISLPASMFKTITDQEEVGIFFAYYDTLTLFPVTGQKDVNTDAQKQSKIIGSGVLAATVGPGLNFQNLTENVTIVLRLISNQVRIGL